MYSFDIETDTSIGEVKTGLSAIRDLRDALVRLIQGLIQRPGKRAYLVLVDPRVTSASLEEELTVFKMAMRLDIAERLSMVIVRNGEIETIPEQIPQPDLAQIEQRIDRTPFTQALLPSPDKQSEVLRVVLVQWLLGRGPMTSDWLSKTVDCNYRTVAAAIDKLGRATERLEDRRVQLKYFPEEAWARFIAVSRRARATMNFVDRSNQPHSAESLLRRLQQMNRPDIAVGGVMGAKHHHPDLDIVSAPRLDICLHAPGKRADLGFVEQLDPALKRDDSPNSVARVALHFLRRKESFFARDETGIVWADPVECLADLFEARLEIQGSEFQKFLSQKGASLRGRQ